MGELFSSEDALDSFIGGAILGGVSSTGQAVVESKKGNDYASGLTDNEKSVVDKVYKDAIAEQEAAILHPKPVAPRNILASEYVTVNGVLYKVTMNIPNGGYIIAGQNAVVTTIEEQLAELAKGE
jgi:hypothetical protein